MSRWGPPEDVTARTAAGGGLACCEHLYPGFERQVQAHPASLPAGALAPSAYRECLDSLWAWLDRSEGVPPQCVTEDHAMAAEHPETEGLFVLATNAVAALCLAREAYERAHAGTNAGRRALNTAGEIAEAAVGPKPLPARPATIAESQRLQTEWLEAIAHHEVVQAERAAQAAAVAALTGGADPASVGEPARRTGQEIARWTVPLLRWAGEP